MLDLDRVLGKAREQSPPWDGTDERPPRPRDGFEGRFGSAIGRSAKVAMENGTEGPELARNGPVGPVLRCPLIGLDRKWRAGRQTDAMTELRIGCPNKEVLTKWDVRFGC
jgi:hypothetical protein